jgi:hypothetical protein
MLERSEGSLQSLAAVGSECCITPSSASRLGLEPIKRSSSSLFFRDRSNLSLCSQMEAIAAEQPGALHEMLGASTYTAFSTLSPLSLTDADSVTLVQCLLLVAMTLQIPNYIDEIIEILELHIHSFPILIVLGVFPSLYFKKKQHKKDSSLNLVSLSTSSIASSKTLAGIEEYYRKCAESDIAKITRPQTPTDDWGHFTDFDESTQYCDQDASSVYRPLDTCTTGKPLYSH